MSDQRADWLDSLKPGDDVAWQGFGSAWHTSKVMKTTPTQIVTDGGSRWRKADGRQIGSSGWNTQYLSPITDGVRTYRLVERFRHHPWHKESLAVLRAVAKVIDDAKA